MSLPQIKIIALKEAAEKIIEAAAEAERFHFVLVLASTKLSDYDGLTAAGKDAQSRRLTPKLDAEALVHGCTASGAKLPTSPMGVTSPVVLTRACLSLLDHKKTLVDAGSFAAPETAHQSLNLAPAEDFSLTDSLALPLVNELFAAGQKAAEQMLPEDYFAVVAECVPAGTTTASAVLELLGTDAISMLSSSVPGNPGQSHLLKADIIERAVGRLTAQLSVSYEELKAACLAYPLKSVAYVGDPMQAYVAGIVVAFAKAGKKPLILAGGSQMLAVYGLARAILESEGWPQSLSKYVAVVTTKYVALDPYAKTKKLAEQIGAPYVAACPDLSKSRHAGLRAYEDGHVKEGVGAGATLALALQRFSEETVINAIDETYDAMTGQATESLKLKQSV